MTTETRSATRSAFGEVLAALMGKRGITATPGNMFELAAEAGLDPGEFMARVAGSMDAHAGSLTGLAEVLELDTPEKEALAVAYTFERSTTSGAIRQCAEEGGAGCVSG